MEQMSAFEAVVIKVINFNSGHNPYSYHFRDNYGNLYYSGYTCSSELKVNDKILVKNAKVLKNLNTAKVLTDWCYEEIK